MPPPTRKNKEQRSAEAEADEHRRRRVLEEGDDDRGTEETETDGEHAGDTAGAEGDVEGFAHRATARRRSGADVAARRERHADVAGETRRHASEQERDGAEGARRDEPEGFFAVRLLDRHRGDEHDHGYRHENHRDRAELALQVGEGADLDGTGNFLHLVRAFILGKYRFREEEAHGDGQQRRGPRERKDQPFATLQGEVLPAAF